MNLNRRKPGISGSRYWKLRCPSLGDNSRAWTDPFSFIRSANDVQEMPKPPTASDHPAQEGKDGSHVSFFASI